MKLFIWRHNRKHHSWSMIEEPCIHQAFYNDAIVMIAANSVDEALELLAAEGAAWLIDDLRRLTPRILDLDQPGIVFQEVRGD